MSRLRSRLTYANVMATIAVFIALGGASYAAIKLPQNSVGARQLKRGAVTPAKLSRSSRGALRGPAGAPGAAGARGETGPRGPSSAYQASNLDTVNERKTLRMPAPAGNYVVSAYMVAVNRESKEDRIDCDVTSSSDRGDSIGNTFLIPAQPTETILGYTPAEVTGAVTVVGNGGAIEFDCEKVEGLGVVELYDARITATAVAELVD